MIYSFMLVTVLRYFFLSAYLTLIKYSITESSVGNFSKKLNTSMYLILANYFMYVKG
jgi:hypothetical protein